MSSSDTVKKVAILGGGLGSIASAWELAHAPEPYDITVYQLGWRLGGKGASGRNLQPDMGKRIEEHGIHVFSGLYDNAFRMMRGAYEELDRPPDAPMGGWLDAFKPHDVMVIEEQWKGEWLPWVVKTPTNEELPGETDATLFLEPSDYVFEALSVFRQFHKKGRGSPKTGEHDKTGEPALPTRGLFGALFGGWLNRDLADIFMFVARCLARLIMYIPFLKYLLLFFMKMGMNHIWQGAKNRLDNADTRRSWLMLNFIYGNAVGAIKCDIFEKGVDYLDQYDYREWLSEYIIDDTVDGHPVTLSSPVAKFIYDAEFAYVDGNLDNPNIGAGSALRTVLRMGLTWKGSLIWEMQAGMGDTIFTPLYEVLKQRGVKFEFFHEITDIRTTDKVVDEIDINVQCEIASATGEYEPLIDVNGLACWPAKPLWDQLVDGKRLESEHVNFESASSPGGTPRTLKIGVDFDFCVLGISIGALPYCAAGLVESSTELKAMVDNIKTVRTQGAQLWCKPTSFQMGWSTMGRPLFSCFSISEMNSWADFTHLLSRESWDSEDEKYPLGIQYWCGPMLDDPFYPTPSGPMQKPEYLDEARGKALAKTTTRELLDEGIGWVWPNAVAEQGNPISPFKIDLLVDNRQTVPIGETAFDAQYFRGNVTPTERFVLTLANTLQYRRYPDQSGFDNLALAGDWTRNDFNIGNVEASVMSGMLAANAISGFPEKNNIVGFGFLAGNIDNQGREL